ncbi:hypothetical protein [Microbacterium sp.]|uniref:hypothetical protein n=1 Tax=Microbacterium sp. TaxID=51671 RepID=UPI0028119275|nr:hypothetical protein [Microbacterium sp.]
MSWEHLFDDLEGQLAAEWEAERAALDAESERLRIAKLALRDRLRTLLPAQGRLRLSLRGGERWDAVLRALGADWIGVTIAGAAPLSIVPLHAVAAIGVDHGMLLASLADAGAEPGLRERMSFGFVLRDLARRRMPVRVGGVDDAPLHGTIDRASADHLDLALHEPGEARLARTVRGFRMIPFETVAWVRPESGSAELL